ncbi:adenylate/guanylate cyclase domain-containing protein [Candidatus Marinimicrobia bacterium MT.SAG.4]|nr:adenylate/guanylate cyclase domain-containing protein [Candidatus Marinimicrobia bacterium MT.SAG.4]
MSDRLKLGVKGAGLGIISALIILVFTTSNWSFLTPLVDNYEAHSYDSRFKARTGDFQEQSIDTVLIVDIDKQSVEELGNYFRWEHDRHAFLIDYLSSGNPKAIIFDIIFDPEKNPYLDTALVGATLRSGIVYHSITISEADTLNFQYPMSAPPEEFRIHRAIKGESFKSLSIEYYGDESAVEYLTELNSDLLNGESNPLPGQLVRIPVLLDTERKALKLDKETARHFPSGERFDNKFINLLNASKKIGSANFPQDQDGVIRRAPTAVYFSSGGQVYPSLVMAAAMDILDVPVDGLVYDFDDNILKMHNRKGEVVRSIPIDDKGRIWVNYYGTYRTFRYIPYSWVNPEMIPAEYFKGKVILVGSSLAGLMDLRSVSVQKSFPGVEIHANTMMSILMDEFVYPISRNQTITMILISSVALSLLLMYFKVFGSIVITILACGLWIVFTYFRFLNGLEVYEVVRPIMTFGMTFLSTTAYKFLVMEKDERFLKTTFATYISPELINQLVESKSKPQLGGESGIKTAFFSDIASFSTFSELLSPTQLVELLNEYLSEMTDILLDEGGTLDKYEGDAIVAFFGAPLPMEDHAARAVRTALRMQEALLILREKWESEKDKWPHQVYSMRLRLGINTGEFVTGNMGSRTRMNYTMMGDVVNTAARLESSAKQYGIYIHCAQNTIENLNGKEFEWRFIDKVKMMGKSKSVDTVEIMDYKDGLSDAQLEMRVHYQQGIEYYTRQNWDDAIAEFNKSNKMEDAFEGRPTNPSRVYLERCEYFKRNPPGSDWDGSWILEDK